jgi:tetratricopeptide (TPR) repeat protein
MRVNAKTVFFPLLCLCAFLPAACESAGGIPGENAKILKSLAGEYFAVAGAYADLKKYDKALEYYRLAARDKKYYTAARYESARMNALLSRWDDAKKIFEELLKNDPRNRDIAVSLAYVRAMSKDLAGAESLYRELLAQNEYDRQIHENFIRILAAQKKKSEAKEAFETFKKLFPSSENADTTAALETLLSS